MWPFSFDMLPQVESAFVSGGFMHEIGSGIGLGMSAGAAFSQPARIALFSAGASALLGYARRRKWRSQSLFGTSNHQDANSYIGRRYLFELAAKRRMAFSGGRFFMAPVLVDAMAPDETTGPNTLPAHGLIFSNSASEILTSNVVGSITRM